MQATKDLYLWQWYWRTSVALAAVLSASALAAAADAPNEQILKLTKERLELVSQVHEMTLAAYRQGVTSLSDVLEARAALLDARLDACATKADRVKVLEEMVKTAEETKTMTERLVQSAEAPQSKLLKAKVHVLEARIRLEREKAAP